MDNKKEKDVDVNNLTQNLNSLTLKKNDIKSNRILKLENDSKVYQLVEIVSDEERITSHIMTMFEFSTVKGIRAQQIDTGGPVFTTIPEGMTDSIKIAEKEIFDRKCTTKIVRDLNKYKKEEWRCNEMIVPTNYRSSYN